MCIIYNWYISWNIIQFYKEYFAVCHIFMSLKDTVPNEIKQTQSGNTLHDLIYLIFSFKEEFKYADVDT